MTTAVAKPRAGSITKHTVEVSSDGAAKVLALLEEVGAVEACIRSNMHAINLHNELCKMPAPDYQFDPKGRRDHFKNIRNASVAAKTAKQLIQSLFTSMTALTAKQTTKHQHLSFSADSLSKLTMEEREQLREITAKMVNENGEAI